MFFSTKDQDNDQSEKRHCAEVERGGWWYKDCKECHLTGQFANISWASPLQSVTMMIREHGIDVNVRK